MRAHHRALLALVLLLVVSAVTAVEDLYAVLGVKRSATAREIKKRFRSLSKQYHPDVNSDPGAKERYTNMMRAYSILEDPKKREQYDTHGIIEGENDQQRKRGFNPFGFGFGRRQFDPIPSATKLMSATDYHDIIHHYRGRYMHIVQVFHSQSPECHMFAPTWEHLAFRSSLRHAATFWRIDLERDPLLVEMAGVTYLGEMPCVFAILDGKIWMMPHVPISRNPGVAVRAVETYLQGLFTTTRSDLNSNTIYTKEQLRGLVELHAARVPLVLVVAHDLNSDGLSVTLHSKFGDRAEVHPIVLSVLNEVFDACVGKGARLRATTVWIYHTSSVDLCSAARYPSAKLNDEDAIIDFVAKRLQKPVPVLTNYTFDSLCGRAPEDDDSDAQLKPCVVEVVKPGQQPKIASLLERRREVVQTAMVDALWEAAFLWDLKIDASKLSADSSSVELLFITRDAVNPRFAHFSGAPSDVLSFVDRMTSRRSASAMKAMPEYLSLRQNSFPMSTWRRWQADISSIASVVPGIDFIFPLLLIFFVSKFLCPRTGPPRTAGNPLREEQAAPGAAPVPKPRGQTPQAASRNASEAAAASSPTPQQPSSQQQPRQQQAMPRAASGEGGAARSQTADAASRTWSGQTDRMAAQKPVPQLPRTISALRSTDIAAAHQSVGTLLVLAFAPLAEGIKAPADAAPLLQYQDVLLRTVSLKRHPKWWAWLRENAQDALREAEARQVPVVVAVRCVRNVAAVMPMDRRLQMWVDSVLEGQVPLAMPVDAAAFTDPA